jgi:hypothetical protein
MPRKKNFVLHWQKIAGSKAGLQVFWHTDKQLLATVEVACMSSRYPANVQEAERLAIAGCHAAARTMAVS